MQHSQENKGLEIYAYSIMSSHIHLLCKATNGFILSDVMRDLKNSHQKKLLKQLLMSRRVKDKVVVLPQDYYFCSARNYAGLENDIDVVLLDLF